MIFKRIELIGFKSFATKTVCEFIPGTTIIVGPNGCGKSNILDAIKWVFGEQAASQLRGKKMRDVIFAGSASFKPLGVAQVTLTIDNTRRLLPMDCSEVQITRRLFRSGESEYLINKVPCRLRDVHELFMGTGAGKSAYSMLEQGRVDQVINAKPVERRFLVEEAAGISKFKIRKLEALRKLERTEVDLSRLNDLISEIERHVNTLRRQAHRAERYKQLVEESRATEQELLVLRARELGEQIHGVDGELDELKVHLAGVRGELGKLSGEEVQARQREAELSEQLSDEKQGLHDVQNNRRNCEHQITRIEDQIGSHTHRLEQIDAEFNDLDVRTEDIHLRLEELTDRVENARNAREEHEAHYQQLRARYTEFEETVRTRTGHIDRLGQQIGELRQAISRDDNQMRTAQALIERQDEVRRESQALRAQLEQSLRAHHDRHAQLRDQVAEIDRQVERLGAEVSADRQRRRELQQQLEQLLKEANQVSGRIEATRSRLETLEELKANYEGYYQGVREVMLAADRAELSGIIGVAPNLIGAEQRFELAIEVALATHLQDIVAETAEDAKSAIEYLKQWGRGRATFLPLDRIQPATLPDRLREVLQHNGVVGVASELVHYDPSIEKAVQFLLGTTIVVEDLDVGLERVREGFRARYVSLDGQLINPAGAMTGGRIKTSGLMTREREVRDLNGKLSELRQHAEQLDERIARLQQELTTGHHQIEARQAELDQQRLEQAGLHKDLQTAAATREQAERDLAERTRQIEQIDQDIQVRRQTVDDCANRLEKLQQELQQSEARLATEQEAARNQGEDFVSLGTAVAEARAEIEKARERKGEATRQIELLRRDLEGLDRQRKARAQEAERIRHEDGRLREQIDRVQQEMGTFGEQERKLREQLTADQDECEQVVLRLRELTGRIQQLTRDEKLLDGKYHEIDLRRTEFKTTLDNLAEQCVEKFDESLVELEKRTGPIEQEPRVLFARVNELRGKLSRIGSVNMEALAEYEQQKERHEFLTAQRDDLQQARQQLQTTIDKLNQTTRKLFQETFETLRANFVETFRRLFNGGKADLVLEAPEGLDPLLDGGIEVMAQPPGKKLQSITLLSGGEKALTAIAILFALFQVKPSPFCILDEIDAPLDDTNVERFKTMLAEFKQHTQFVVITHNKLTMEMADVLYGVTMEESGVSKLVSVRFDQAEQMVDAV